MNLIIYWIKIMNRISKIKKTKINLVYDEQWYNFIIQDQISHDFPKDNIYYGKENNIYYILFQNKLYSFSLFEKNNEEEFKGFDYIFKTDKETGILLIVNSLWTKYKIACFTKD